MDSTRFLKITIVVLLIINIATLTFMWISHRHHAGHMPPPPMHGPGGPGGGNAFHFLARQLDLSEEQLQKLEAMRNEHHEAAGQIHRQTGSMHHRFFDLLAGGDSAAVSRLADSMAMLHRQMELLTFDHFRKVRAICTPEQQKKFDEVINEALEMMAPRPPHAPGPPPHP
jgi:periplasmic protein CpxP/Spy